MTRVLVRPRPGTLRAGDPAVGTFRSFRVPNYRRYALGQAASTTGTWMQWVAQDWLVLSLTDSGTALGVITVLQFIPMALLVPWGGVLADRLPKRPLLMATGTAMGVLAALLGVLAVTGTARLWQVYPLAFVAGLVTAVDQPARQTFLAEMVGREDLPNAVALNSAIFSVARLVGPAGAGLLIAATGPGWVFLLNAATYAMALTGLARMDPGRLRPARLVPRGPGRLRAGLRYVLCRRDLLLPVAVMGGVGTFGLNFQITLALMSARVFHTGPRGFGLLSSALAAGSLAGALMAARRRRYGPQLVIVSALVLGILEVAAAVAPTWGILLALLILCGMAALTVTTAAGALLQLRTPEGMRGRVMGLYTLVVMGGTALGALPVGWAADCFGPRWCLAAGGVAIILHAALVAWLLGRHGWDGTEDRKELTGRHPAEGEPSPAPADPALPR